jgi:hypothetical protein
MYAGQAFRAMITVLAAGTFRHNKCPTDLAGETLSASCVPVIHFFIMLLQFRNAFVPLLVINCLFTSSGCGVTPKKE